MPARTLAIASFVALAVGLAGLPALAQTTTQPAAKKGDKRDTNKDGVLSQDEMQQAREQYRQRYLERFKAADTNNDGGLSRAEIKASKKFLEIDNNFDAIDANRDGKVTLDERRAWGQKQQAAKKGTTGTTSTKGTTGTGSSGGLLPPR